MRMGRIIVMLVAVLGFVACSKKSGGSGSGFKGMPVNSGSPVMAKNAITTSWCEVGYYYSEDDDDMEFPMQDRITFYTDGSVKAESLDYNSREVMETINAKWSHTSETITIGAIKGVPPIAAKVTIDMDSTPATMTTEDLEDGYLEYYEACN